MQTSSSTAADGLHDQYELPPEAVWSTVRKRGYERITLHPKDQRYELVEPARVMSGGPFPLVYGNLIEELRDELSAKQNGKAPVFPFGYDWRLPLDRIEEALASFVREVIDRTMLLPHYRDDDGYAANPTVNLIGHSMGGLLIAGYIERHGGARVNKVVTLATPFQGSLEAVLKLTTGTADLGDEPGNARERRMARMTPALYHLLSSFEGNLTVDLGLEADIFEPEAWQPSVLRTIEQQVRGLDVSASGLFADMLGAAREHRDRISASADSRAEVLRYGTADELRRGVEGGSGGAARLEPEQVGRRAAEGVGHMGGGSRGGSPRSPTRSWTATATRSCSPGWGCRGSPAMSPSVGRKTGRSSF